MDLAAIAARVTIARLILAIAGVLAMAWAVAVIPVILSENAIVDVARAIIDGEAFKAEVLAAVLARTETNGDSGLRSSVLSKAAMIRLRQADDAIRAGNLELVKQKLESLTRTVQEALRNARTISGSFGSGSIPPQWLATDNLAFLQMSYDLGRIRLIAINASSHWRRSG